MDAQIEITRGRLLSGRVIYIRPGEEVTFGSGPQNFVSVEGEGLAERHGVVRFDGDDLVVVAEADGAEIRVDGRPARRAVLAAGSLVEAGGLAFSISRLERPADGRVEPVPAVVPPVTAPPSPPLPVPPPSPSPPPPARPSAIPAGAATPLRQAQGPGAAAAPAPAPSGPGLVAQSLRFAGWTLAACARAFALLPLQCRWLYFGILRDRVQLRIGREVCAQKGELQKTETLARELHEWEQISFKMGNLHEEKARARARIRAAFDRAMGRAPESA